MRVDRTTVLVADDDPVIVKLLQVNFEMEGFTVLTATDGAGCLERASRELPDIVVLDVMMPGMDGQEVARRLHADPSTASIPILFLSAKAQASDIARGLEVADGYMTKPFEPLELLDRVAELVALKRPAPGAGSGHPSLVANEAGGEPAE